MRLVTYNLTTDTSKSFEKDHFHGQNLAQVNQYIIQSQNVLIKDTVCNVESSVCCLLMELQSQKGWVEINSGSEIGCLSLELKKSARLIASQCSTPQFFCV